MCLLAKLFLDHKTLYYDVSGFVFYVLYEIEEGVLRPAGYFSKEKQSEEAYNLACIMILPPHQRKGYGRLLIELSYELCKRAGITGTPEKPLSDLGAITYRSFWTYELLRLLRTFPKSIVGVQELEMLTGFKGDDIVETLAPLDLIRTSNKHGITVHIKRDVVEEHWLLVSDKKHLRLDLEYVLT